jgi:CRP-like cAMP-binding protein
MLSVTAMTDIDVLTIESSDFNDCKGSESYELSTDDKLRFLKTVPVFHDWEPYHLYLIAQNLQHQDLRENKMILETGHFSDNLYFLLYGKVNLMSNLTRRNVLATMDIGEYFGEASVLNHFFSQTIANKERDKESKEDKPYNKASLLHQTKRERRLLRKHGDEHGDPEVFFEMTDSIAGTHVELLVLNKKHFQLLSLACANLMRSAYYNRIEWRFSRSKLLTAEDRKVRARV